MSITSFQRWIEQRGNLDTFKKSTNAIGMIGVGLFGFSVGHAVLVRLGIAEPFEQSMQDIVDVVGIIGMSCFLVVAVFQSSVMNEDRVAEHNTSVEKRKEEKRLRRKASADRKKM